MRIIIALCLITLFSCDSEYNLPDQHSGRYYGIDSIFRNQFALQLLDTLSNPVYLDVESLGSGLYDVYNDNGYWVRDGLITQNKLAIDISDFEGFIHFLDDSIYLEATANTDLILVSHKAYLSR